MLFSHVLLILGQSVSPALGSGTFSVTLPLPAGLDPDSCLSLTQRQRFSSFLSPQPQSYWSLHMCPLSEQFLLPLSPFASKGRKFQTSLHAFPQQCLLFSQVVPPGSLLLCPVFFVCFVLLVVQPLRSGDKSLQVSMNFLSVNSSVLSC